MAIGMSNRVKIADNINNRARFAIASMSGKWVSDADHVTWGELPAETKTEMIELLKTRNLYLVYSYETPIAYAWGDDVIVPDTHYSKTTSDHQKIARLTKHYASMA